MTLRSFLISLSVLCLATSARAEQWRVATLAPDGSAWMKILGRGAKELEDKTAGRVTIKYYTGGNQGGENDVVRKMDIGALDGAALTAQGLAMIDPSIRVLELPRLFETEEELDYVRDKMWPTFQARFAKKGYRLSEPGDVGFIYLYSLEPIRTMADLQKAKLWKFGDDDMGSAVFDKFKLRGVSLSVPEVMPALTTGRINACGASPLALIALQWHTKVKYVTTTAFGYGIGASVVKLAKYEALSPEDKQILIDVTKNQSVKLRTLVRKDNKKAQKTLARSIQEIELDPALLKEIDTASKESWQRFAGKTYSKEDLAQVLKYRDEYRKAH